MAAAKKPSCSKCARPAAAGRKQCKYHLEYFRKYRLARRQSGLCIHCGAKSSGYQLCQACAERSSQQMRERYDQRRAAGLCVACGSRSGEASLCPRCSRRKTKRRRELASDRAG